jgi:hypothetical protein
MELMRRHAFLAGVHQVEAENPFRQRDVRPLHHRANGDGEVLATLVALMQAGAVRLAL